ncbi:glutamate receptor ionotropic, NMDA 2B-like [Macrobrachium nipponense]|uniref:glutamate receptor ionotropic, NMDA 2B-like n=1 Tax=Macrobrachium nipponense TaxID=159736 RepID=UPI0030C7C578
MDGSNFSMNIFEAFHALNVTHLVAVMETRASKQSNLLVSELTSVVQALSKIKRMSPCLTIVLANDDIDFLINFIGISSDNGLLVTYSALLFTHMTSDSLQMVQDQLSIINAAVVSLKELEIYQRLTEGGHLTIAAIFYPTHSIMKVSTAQNGSSTVTLTGPIMEVLEILSTSINFTYDLVPFISYGYLLPNGSWNGLVGAVYNKEADIALGPLAITYERAKVVQYTEYIFDDYLRILARRGDTEVDPWSFVMAFNKEVWASLFASLALTVIVSSICAKIAFGEVLPKSSVFGYYRILVQQDIDDKWFPWWERMIFGGWLLTVLISAESYSGNLMSLLAVRYISQPYQSLRIVLDDPRIKIMWLSNTVYEQYLKESVDSIRPGKSTFLLLSHWFRKTVPYFRASMKAPSFYCEGGLYNHWLEKAVPLAQGCNNPPTKFTVKSSLTVPELGAFTELL